MLQCSRAIKRANEFYVYKGRRYRVYGWILTHLDNPVRKLAKANDFSFDCCKKMGRVEDYHPRRAKNSALMTFPSLAYAATGDI